METNNDKLARILSDGAWHTAAELTKGVSHRFGATILILRKGDYDGRCWVIESERSARGWLYRWTGFQARYETEHAKQCPNCGFKLPIYDVRAEAT